jgi:FeS assembly SUF system protein
MSDETIKVDAAPIEATPATAVTASVESVAGADVAAVAIGDSAAATGDPAAPGGTAVAPTDPTKFIETKLIEGKVIEALQQIFDPEIPVNIYELGLIYVIDVQPDNSVLVKMTLTAPACPVAGTLPGEVETKINAIPEVKEAKVELVWDPPWTREMMSESAILQLGF